MIEVKKRHGGTVEFDGEKIVNAIEKAMAETKAGVHKEISKGIAEDIEQVLVESENVFSVEDISDLVEVLLAENGRFDAAKRYILYRQERNQARNTNSPVSEFAETTLLSNEFLSKYKHKPDPFDFELGKFVYYRTYSRPIPEENRRERWWETCRRVVEFNFDLQLKAMKKQRVRINPAVLAELKREAEDTYDMMYHLKLFPSGRTLWTGGTLASYKHPLSNFNCSAVVIDSLKKFPEIFFVLMLGTGTGLSVEKKYVNQLPKINSAIEIVNKDFTPVAKRDRNEHTELRMLGQDSLEIVVGDSKNAWSKAIEFYLDVISNKQYSDIKYILLNYDNVRPMGERLKTFGGFASGHNAIKTMFEKIDAIFKKKREINKQQWQTIKPIDCLDIATSIAENVIAGGSRRSAQIVFCDPDDKEVMEAKQYIYTQDENGNWQSNNELSHRMLSNNTVLYEEKPTRGQLSTQFKQIRYAGEPSFGNLQEMRRRKSDATVGNPCFEILLTDRGVCNLTEVNLMGFVNSDGTFDKGRMLRAQEYSARMGYRMATIELELHEWDLVSKKDMLTGCSLTGVMDFINATKLNDEELKSLLSELRGVAHSAANEMADYLKMNRPKLTTTVKPSGTISQLPTVSSGMHFAHSPYYIRRVRASANDPLSKAMIGSGFKWHPEVGQTEEDHTIKVFEFPVKAPEGRTKYDVGAIEQLELYRTFMKHYVDHNASNTIHVRPEEWEDVEKWVYDNWDDIVGVTFLALDDSFYQLLPYEAIDKERYEEMMKQTPKFDPGLLRKYENLEEEFELLDEECTSGACPIR